MAQNKYALARYSLIDYLLQRNKYVKTTYIVKCCKEQLRCNITQRTIQMDISAMKHDSFLGYFAPIQYCSRKKAYYYAEDTYQLSPFRFSDKEISLMQKILFSIQNNVSEDESELFHVIVEKIKTYGY